MRKKSRIRPVFTIPEECDDDCKKKIINDVLSQIYPQLQINALKVASDSSPWLEDILPHAIITYLEKPLSYQWKVIVDNKLEEFITYVMAFQLKSGNSPFYGQYRRFGMKWDRNVEIGNDEKNRFGSEVFEVFADEKSNKLKIAERIYNSLNFYEQNIVQKIFIEGWKITQFSEYYGIPYNEATNNVYSLKQKLQRRVKGYKEKYDI